jgi:hypothetical protein
MGALGGGAMVFGQQRTGGLLGLLHDLVFLLELGLAAEEGHGSIIKSRRNDAEAYSGRSKLRAL